MISFTGKLEHLPIVDVMQLLHQGRKSGILRIQGRKGESQLVFKDGYMVSANHLNSRIRIGQILVNLNIITPEMLDRALREQGSAGAGRKPLIVTLIEQGVVNEKGAYQGLEHLIELAVVEILTWKKGSFSFEVLPASVTDFSFYPEKLMGEVTVDTQSALMEALRVYDEKKRDGELTEEDPEDVVVAKSAGATAPAEPRQLRPNGRLVQCPRCNNTLRIGKHVAVWSTDMNSAPLPVLYTGRGCAALGVALLCYGLYGLASYYGNDWQAILSEGRWEPVPKREVFFRLGFIPWLFTLFSSMFLTAARRFLLLRERARKEMQMTACAGIAIWAVQQTAGFISWIKMANAPTFSYCAVGVASSLLNTVVFSIPFLALLWYLQSKAITREFPE